MKKLKVYQRFLIWRLKSIGQKQFILILSALIGLGVGLAAVIIKNLVHWIQLIFTQEFVQPVYHYLYFILPIFGILLTILFIRHINKRPVGHGIPSVLYAISKSNGIIRRHNLYSSVIASALTVGFGGSVGLEGPTVATGAAIGSNIGRYFRLNYKQVTLLLGCACAGAMSAIFKAPIAAIVFALEVIMLDLTLTSLIPLLISSITAALTSYLFLGQNVLYSFQVKEAFIMGHIPYYILIGILAGLMSVYFTKMYIFVTGLFEKIKGPYMKLIIGGSVLGLLILLVPSLFGEGYEPINNCLSGNYGYLFENSFYEKYADSIGITLVVLFFVLMFKVIATSVTFGAGGIGGIFAPSLFIGSNLGLFFAKIVNLFGVDLSESNFALVGMTGLIAGVIHAPLTAIFLIAEITGGYELFFPLMLVSTISFATTRIFTANSVYTVQLAKRGELLTHDRDKNVLLLMNVDRLIEKDFLTVSPDDTLSDLVKVVKRSSRNVFPVVDDENTFYGIVKMDDIRHIMFNTEMYDTTFVRDLLIMPRFTIQKDESMEEVAKKFQVSGRYNIVILDEGKYLGFVSRATVFSAYREKLKQISME